MEEEKISRHEFRARHRNTAGVLGSSRMRQGHAKPAENVFRKAGAIKPGRGALSCPAVADPEKRASIGEKVVNIVAGACRKRRPARCRSGSCRLPRSPLGSRNAEHLAGFKHLRTQVVRPLERRHAGAATPGNHPERVAFFNRHRVGTRLRRCWQGGNGYRHQEGKRYGNYHHATQTSQPPQNLPPKLAGMSKNQSYHP